MDEERAQRRLAAILAADVIGYSRLTETDETGTLAALKARRKGVLDPLVANHNRAGAACKRRCNFIAEVAASEEFPCQNRRCICKVTGTVSRDLERCQCVHGPIS